MLSPTTLLAIHVSWATVGGTILSAAGLFRTVLAGWQHFEKRRERRRIEKSFGADYYQRETIDTALRYYVRPYCTSVDPSQEAEIRGVISTREDLFDVVDRFLEEESPHRHILLLADSGMGKTTFAINYYAQNLRKRRRRRLAVVPLGLPNVLEDIAKIDHKKDTVIFLDAFDEDEKAKRDHRARLDELMKACSGFDRVLITCRTQFFACDEEIPRNTGLSIVGPRRLGESAMYEFWKLYISPLTDGQIAAFLRKRYPVLSWKKRRDAFQLITKIPLLTVRPMLLAYLPDFMKASRRIDYAFHLYEILIDQWLIREKGWIEPDLLREVSEKLAVDVYTNSSTRGAERLPSNELTNLLRKFDSKLDALVVRRRSLLNRDALGNLKFAHRSIMEYLFVHRFVGLPPGQRPTVRWTDLMKLFATEMIRAHSSEDLGPESSPQQMQHADLSGVEFHVLNATSVRFDNAQLLRLDVSGSSFKDCTFRNADLRESNFSGCKLTDVDFTGANLRNADFRNTVRLNVVMTGADSSGMLVDPDTQLPAQPQPVKSQLLLRSPSAAIELGTSRTSIYVRGMGILAHGPSVVAINESTGKMEAVGEDAVELARHDGWKLAFPIQEGVISDPDLATAMLRSFLVKAQLRGATDVIIPVPAGATKANLKAFYDVAKAAKVNKVSFVEKGMAAAIGAGLPIMEPYGNMILEMGAGHVDLAVISLGGIVLSRSIRAGGNYMNEEIVKYLKRKYNLLIGLRTAEQIKIEIGAAYQLDRPLTMEVAGRNSYEGTPQTIVIDDSEICEAIFEPLAMILNAIRAVLEQTPPELSADIIEQGIVLSGGGAMLKRLDQRIRVEISLAVSIADDPLCSVILGAGKALIDRKIIERIRLRT